jgi:hypothetical protein
MKMRPLIDLLLAAFAPHAQTHRREKQCDRIVAHTPAVIDHHRTSRTGRISRETALFVSQWPLRLRRSSAIRTTMRLAALLLPNPRSARHRNTTPVTIPRAGDLRIRRTGLLVFERDRALLRHLPTVRCSPAGGLGADTDGDVKMFPTGAPLALSLALVLIRGRALG